jgi:hypothetical protein
LALREFVKKGAMYFTGILMEGPQVFRIIAEENLVRPLIKEILREIELSSDKYEEYLRK